jgi:phosphatidylglycerophosphatase C
MNLVLFDFDGTLTRKDSFKVFVRHYHGSFKFYGGIFILSPYLVLHAFKLLSSHRLKEIVLRFYFKNFDETELREKAKSFAENVLPKHVKDSGLEAMKQHLKDGNQVVIVSASLQLWLQPWVDKMNANAVSDEHENSLLPIELIATKMEYKNGKVVGNLEGKNCKGEEKVKRIKAKYHIADYNRVIAFGDTSGDREMLALADEPHYRVFK